MSSQPVSKGDSPLSDRNDRNDRSDRHEHNRRRHVRCLWFAALSVLATSCSLKVPSADDVSIRPTEDQVQTLLHKLFPSLSDEEVARFSAKLDVAAALNLKLEIDDIRRVADKLGKDLGELAAKASSSRQTDLEAHNGGFPLTIEPIGRAAFYESSQGKGRLELSGVFRDREPVSLLDTKLSIRVDGNAQSVTLDCVPQTPVDIVFVVDITGSMSPVIGAVRRSLATFVSAIVSRKIRGTLSVVTFQDSVGVNVDFQERAPASKFERSPFFKPVAIDDTVGMAELERFIGRLEANSGADTPENLAGALDFARNNVIGLTSKGQPNLIGDGVEDPRDVAAWPKLMNDKQIFVVFTDAPFHSDSRTPKNSSLLAAFKPRATADILKTLQSTGTTVHVSDPSWVDETREPTGASSEVAVDADFWAEQTGGLGEDRTAGYSLVDLDVLVVAKQQGLLDILLDGVIGTSCSARFTLPTLSASASFELEIELEGQVFSESLVPVRL
jgi:hypothetical protein